MEFSGDRPHSAPFVVTEESIHYWARPWEELDANYPPSVDQGDRLSHGKSGSSRPSRRSRLPKTRESLGNFPKRSILGEWLVWSLITLAYVGTVSIIGYSICDMVGHWGHQLSQSYTRIGF